MLVGTLGRARSRFGLVFGLAVVRLVPGTAADALAQAPAPPSQAPAPAAEPAPERTVLAAPPPGSADAPASALLSPAKLESLVAPLALYPDPLLSQALVASTYPLEIIEAQQWSVQNPSLKGDALLEAAKKQAWDPSVQSLVAFPDALKRLSENIRWTTDLGNAFLAQQSEVMAAIQRLRIKAKDSGKLTSTEQQTVTTKVVEKETVVVVEPAKTEVVYVPVYDPALVWGPPAYPYPPVYYPPPPPAGAMLVSFGVGMMVGAAIHGGWGYGCGWGHSNVVVVNHHNTFVSNSNRVNHTRVEGGDRNSTWQHDPAHRRSAAYPNNDLSRKYGAAERTRPTTTPLRSDRSAGTADRSGAGSVDGRPASVERAGGNRAGGFERSSDRSPSGANRAAGDGPGAERQRSGFAGRGGGGGRRR